MARPARPERSRSALPLRQLNRFCYLINSDIVFGTHSHLHGVGTQNRNLSRLNGWPMRPPVNASPKPSRVTAHDSGPMWIATPSSEETCTLYSLPVSRRFANNFRFAPVNGPHHYARSDTTPAI